MQQWIDPLTLSRIKDMPLVAKTVAEGILQGQHTSVQKGSGIEFSQYRSYEPGDELSKVDWKLFARSDRYFVREAERESDTHIWLVLDASQSMLQQSVASKAQNGWHKLDYARYFLATIAYIAQQQGDSVGLIGLSDQQVDYLPCGSGQRHWHKLMLQLSQLKVGKQFPNKENLHAQLGNIRPQGLIFVLSDFIQHDREILDFMQPLNHSKNELVALQLICDDEVNFPYKGAIRVEDPETQQQRLVSSQDVKASYLAAYQNFQVDLQNRLTAQNVNLFTANIDQPLDESVHAYLASRRKVR
ncbi:DUF58 domain-containing protein [uncultured Paraglaciecola sp.]|uniref:DUF58 domain-containing protein n=1 Tax=uncultured Paraglaciecola sp. TaxID=1765024 RepID=UPI0030DCD61E|tara:strand:+ start:482 stop:1384 length:903 start_codon:yes stop_codon:yes gene_type:complete